MVDVPKISLSRIRSDELRAEREPGGGVVGFMSWNRLVETLRKTREVKPTETVLAIVLEDGGLRIYYGENRG